MPNERNDSRTFHTTPFEEILAGQADSSTPAELPRSTRVPDEQDAFPDVEAQSAGPMAIDRILNAIGRGANRAITDGGALGLSPETVVELRRRGFFNSSNRENSVLPEMVDEMLVLPRTAIELLVRNAFALGDLASRTRNGISEGLISSAGQTARELGASDGMAKRLERDLRMIDQVAGRGRFGGGGIRGR